MGQRRVDEHVYARHLTIPQRPLECGLDLLRALYELPVTPQSLCHQVVAHQSKLGSTGPVMTEEHLLAMFDHTPCLVVANDADNGQIVSHSRVDLHT